VDPAAVPAAAVGRVRRIGGHWRGSRGQQRRPQSTAHRRHQ
jgi:hypothetical protein